MFAKLDLFKMSHQMAVHAGRKQAIAAQNIANADTPGYIGHDLPDFQDTFKQANTMSLQRASRAGHLNGVSDGFVSVASVERRAQASPDGNNVSVETEMLKSVEAKRQHDRALAIYKSGLNILRSAVKG